MYIVAVDIEGTKIPLQHPWQRGAYMCSVGIKTSDGFQKEYILTHRTERTEDREKQLKEIQSILDKADLFVAHNAKFDRNHLKWVGLDVGHTPWWCTQVGEYLLCRQDKQVRLSLNASLKRYGYPTKIDKMAYYWNELDYQTDEIPIADHKEYLRRDVDSTMLLYYTQAPMIHAMGLDKLMRMQCQLVTVLSDMEVTGVGFDKEKAEGFYQEAVFHMEELQEQIGKYVSIPNFNAGSSQQKSVALFGGELTVDEREQTQRVLKNGTIKYGSRKVSVRKYFEGVGFTPVEEVGKSGYYPVGKDEIPKLRARTKAQKELKELFLEYAKHAKVASTLLTKSEDSGLLRQIGSDGRIHPQYNMTVTATGRLSSKEPNGQNLPRKGTNPIKKCFVPRSSDRVMVNLDLAQIEFRIAAALSNDPRMLHDLWNGYDTHADNASKIFLNGAPYDPNNKEHDEYRTLSKKITFRLLYGGSAGGFDRDGQMPDLGIKRWRKVVEQYGETFPRLMQWQDENLTYVNRHGTMTSPTGRQYKYKKDQYRGGYMRSQVCNYIVQSAASDVMYLVMCIVARKLREMGVDADLVLQVHDSMVFECNKKDVNKLCRLVVDLFESSPKLVESYFGWKFTAPLTGDAEVGPTYGDQKKYTDF